jgi:hypothetical protein
VKWVDGKFVEVEDPSKGTRKKKEKQKRGFPPFFPSKTRRCTSLALSCTARSLSAPLRRAEHRSGQLSKKTQGSLTGRCGPFPSPGAHSGGLNVEIRRCTVVSTILLT